MADAIQLQADNTLKTRSNIPLHAMTEAELLARLESSRSQATQGEGINARDAVLNLREKYGL